MAASPNFKVYRDGEYLASFHHASDAAIIIAAWGRGQIRSGHSLVLWNEGADEPAGDLREWLTEWLPRVTRSMRHPGNHKYAWGLSRAVRRTLPATLPYPKIAA